MEVSEKIDLLCRLLKQNIRNERIALKLDQNEFAKFVNIKFSTYKAFEQSGKISINNLLKILIKLNKDIEFKHFLNGFEFDYDKSRVSKNNKNVLFKPLIPISQKQIKLDKNVFGYDLFYSVEDGHIYNISNFITILLSSWNDERLMLLIEYFGPERLKPYIVKNEDFDLLRAFNIHLTYCKKYFYQK